MSIDQQPDPTEVAPMSTADAIPAEGAPATGVPAVDPLAVEATPVAAAAETAQGAPAAAATAVPKKPGRVAVYGRRFVRFAFTVALLAAGAYAGWQLYLTNRPAPLAPVGDPGVLGVAAPAVVAELASAIDADDADRIRTALNPDVFNSYTAELQKYDLSGIERVETLGTFKDGPRNASMLVLHARRTDTSPFTLFLVVITENGQIVRLR